jgi:hypothetical protein
MRSFVNQEEVIEQDWQVSELDGEGGTGGQPWQNSYRICFQGFIEAQYF